MIFKDEVYSIIGAAIEVHRELGPGFLEAVYQEALEKELTARSIPFISQAPVTIVYKGQPLEQVYIADIVCHDQIILELKAVTCLNEHHMCQMMNYLKATQHSLGLLINFCSHPKLEWKRIVLTEDM